MAAAHLLLILADGFLKVSEDLLHSRGQPLVDEHLQTPELRHVPVSGDKLLLSTGFLWLQVKCTVRALTLCCSDSENLLSGGR